MDVREPRGKVDPLILILLNLFMPVLLMFYASDPLQVWLLLFALLILALHGRFWRLVRFLIAYLLLRGGVLALFSLEHGASNTLAGVLTVMAAFLPCLMLASVLIFDTKPSELMSALERLRLPRVFIIALTITLRYVPTFGKEFRIIRSAMKVRGIDPDWRHPIRTMGFFLTPQLFRCMILAEEITAAGMIKGIDASGRRSSYFGRPFRVLDVAVVLVFLVGTTGGCLWKTA